MTKKQLAKKKMIRALEANGPMMRHELARATGYTSQYISLLLKWEASYFEIEKVERLDRANRARLMLLISLKVSQK